MGIKIQDVKEQIQEDVITYMESYTPPFTFTDDLKRYITDDVCDIVVNNFEKIELKRRGLEIGEDGTVNGIFDLSN